MRRKIELLGLAISTALVVSCSQPTEDSAKAANVDARLEHAREIYAREGAKEAFPLFQQVLAAYQAEGDRLGEAITLGLLGNCYKRFGDFARARQELERALSMKRELGDRQEVATTLNHLGLLFWEMGAYDDAIQRLNESIAEARQIADRELEAAALNNLSLVYDELGDYERSLEQYQQALELQRAVGDEEGESAVLGNIGGVQLLLGRYRECLRYYGEALAISRRLELKPSESQDLGNQARCLMYLGRLEDARAAFEEALSLARGAGMRKEEADWLTGLAEVLVRRGRYEEALDEYERALETYESAGLKRELVETLTDVGELRARLGENALAERDFRRVLDVAREIRYTRGVTMTLLALGEIESRRDRPEEALALYRQALDAARASDEQDYVAKTLIQIVLLPDAATLVPKVLELAEEAVTVTAEMEAPLLRARAYYAQGEVLRRRGLFERAVSAYASAEEQLATVDEPETRWQTDLGKGRALTKLGRRAEAIDSLKAAVRTIEDVRARLRVERHRAGYLEDRDQAYVELVELLLKTGDRNQAFEFSEKLRARSFLDLLQRGAPPIRDVRKRETEQELLERIRSLDSRILDEGQGSSESATRALTSELLAAETDYARFLGALREDEPGYAQIRSLDVSSAPFIAGHLPDDAALVEYLVAPAQVILFVLTRHGLHTSTVSASAKGLYARVQLLRDLLSRTEEDSWSKPAARLDELLIEPLVRAGWLEGIRELYLVPNGILYSVPFSALPRFVNGERRFLGDDFTVTYLPQASAARARSEAPARSNLLALAPSSAGLPLAVREVEHLATVYGDAEVLLDDEARESVFKAEAGRFGRIHLATHGYFDPLDPLRSGVELEPGEGEDGRLEVREILNLRLAANLVTLSACETGLGAGYFNDIPAGDDLVGLSRAFLYAGSRSVLASLWQVEDQSTLELMRAFYAALEQQGPAQALATAQRALSREDDGVPRHPYYWAGFVLLSSPT